MTKDKATNVSIKDILVEIKKGPDYMKKVVDDFRKDCETLIRSMSDLYKEHLIVNNFCNVSFKFELYGFDSLLMQTEFGTNCKRNNDEDTYTNIADLLLETLKNVKTEDNVE